MSFTGIVDQIVQFRPSGLDILEPIARDRQKGAGIVFGGQQAFAVDITIVVFRRLINEGAAKIPALDILRCLNAQQRANRRSNIDQADCTGDRFGRLLTGQFDDQGNMDRFLVDVVAVPHFFTLTKCLAMVTGDDQQGRIIQIQRFELVDYLPDAVVGIRELLSIGQFEDFFLFIRVCG